ncbi:hypothetical protein DITRI_Ditri09bG0091200 [Diplodiscus trichospermus]
MAKLVVHPRTFARNHDKFRRTVEEVKKLGFNPSKQLFLIALQALTQISKSRWESKSNAFRQWGWTDEDIVSAFEKYPKYMNFSEHKITAAMNFYVNTMGCKSSYIANFRALFSYSLQRRLIPRGSVVQALLSKGLIEKFNTWIGLGTMFYSFLCKTQIYIKGGTWVSPISQYLNFLQNYAVIPVAVRYVSRIASNEHSFTVSYLVNSCGFSPESALSVSKKIHFDTPKKPDSVLSFFKNHGFSLTLIRDLIKRKPKVLLFNPEQNLLPKFQFFYSKSISSSKLARILSSNPHVLESDLDKRIIPSFNFFKELCRCDDDKVFLAYKNFSSTLIRNLQPVFAPNLGILREIGVPESYIMAKLVVHPRIFAENHEKFRRTAEEVKNSGFNPSKQFFLVALQALLQISKSTWERKSNAFRKWGWTDEDIVSAFEKYPRCMIFSEQKITASLNFYVNTMGWKSSYIATYPILLSYSLERRIIPRCSVLLALLSKGLIEKFSVHTVMISTENDFLRKFVIPYEDPYLLKLYEEKRGLSY